MDVKDKIAEWQKDPKRSYSEGVALLKVAVRKWLVNPYFDKREDWKKLEYELSKVVPVEEAVPAETVSPVEDGKTDDSKKEETPPADDKNTAADVEKVPAEPIKVVGKIDRDKLTPEQQQMFDEYLENYDIAIAMHEKLKKAASDDERQDILSELVKQDEKCGKLWEALENSVNGVTEPPRADEKAQGEGDGKAKAIARLAELNELIPQKEEALKNSKAKGAALTKQTNSLTKLLTERAEIEAKYGKE